MVFFNLHCIYMKLGLTIICKKTKPLAVLPPNDPAAKSPVPIHLVPEGEPIEVLSHFQYLGSIVQDDCGTHKYQLQDLQGFICLPVIFTHPVASMQDPDQHQVSSFQPCCMAWRALSSLNLLCTNWSPLWSVACRSSWGFLSGRRSDAPPCARWPSSRGFHPSSLSAVCVSLNIYPGCQRKDCLSSFLCLLLLGASILLGARSIGECSEAVQPVQELEGASTRPWFLENYHQMQSRASQQASGRQRKVMQRWKDVMHTTASCYHWECSTLQPAWPSFQAWNQAGLINHQRERHFTMQILPPDIPSAGASEPTVFLSIQIISNVQPVWMACISAPH